MALSPTELVELFESLLLPIPGAALPAGDSLSVEFLDEIQEVIRETDNNNEPRQPDWGRARELAEEILRNKSKHLQAASAYVEAIARTEGWAAAAPGLKLLQDLMDKFWDEGLLPVSVEGDNAYRARPIENLARRLALILREVPLTQRADGENLSWNSRHNEAKLAMWEPIVGRTPLSFYEGLQQQIETLSTALHSFESKMIEDRLFGSSEAPNTSSLRETIRDIKGVIDPIIEDKRKAAADGETEDVAGADPVQDDPGWSSARRMLGTGRVKDAIREMTRLASQEHGRNRFLRKLELAELLIRDLEQPENAREIKKPDQVMLAIVILEDLEEQIGKHTLDVWESPQLIGRILGQLARLCERVPIKQSRAADLRQRLRKLDPWQALRWE
jgi:hypothetical protein